MTISPRITQRLMTEQSLASMQTALGRVAKTQEQLTTGRVINRPSDSPTGTNSAMRLREQVAQQGQFKRNAEDGLARLSRIDDTLTSSLDQVRRVRDLTLQGSSTGSMGLQAREALAAEVAQIREALVAQANTQHLGRPLFGGATSRPTAYVKDGSGIVTYQGDDTPVHRRVGSEDKVRVDLNGPEVFGAGADDLFVLLDEIAANLVGDTDALAANLESLDGAMQRITTAVVEVGARVGRLESTVRSTTDAELDLQTALSQVENVDMARAMVDLQMNEVAYQASLGATARVMQPSLLDFLR